MDKPTDDLPEITPQQLAEFRECHFIHQVFEARSAYKSVHPMDIMDFLQRRAELLDDPEQFEVIEGGWDHEHCDVCCIRIEPGDWYWANERPGDIDLCEKCYQRVRWILQGQPPR